MHWDERLLSMLKACPSPRAVLTTYPPGYHLPDLIPDEAVTKGKVGTGEGRSWVSGFQHFPLF